MDTKQANEIIAGLSRDAIDSKSINVDWREAMGENGEGWRSFEVYECEECALEHVLGPYGETACNDSTPEIPDIDDDGDDCGVKPNECMGYMNADGPMMNYLYPVKLNDCEQTARDIGTGCVCVVELEDGRTGLALTGSGMDLTWEICEAFIAAGFLPPAHFAGSLPDMAGWKQEDKLLTLLACKKSCEVALNWNRNRLDDTSRKLEQWLAAQDD